MNLVEEQNRSLPVHSETLTGGVDDLAHVLHSRGHRTQLRKMTSGASGHRQRQRRFPGAGRTPENGAAQLVLFHQSTQRLAGSDQVLLSDHVVDARRSQASGERCLFAQAFLGGGAEEVAHGRIRENARAYAARRNSTTWATR